jgi:hypothetical protein
VLWDGTDPVDSQALGKGLDRLGWKNQVKKGDKLAQTASGQPSVLQPAGAKGFDLSNELMFRAMFEFPQALLGKPLKGDGAGHMGSMVAYSGHGVPGFMFSESLLPIGMSRPIETSAADVANAVGNWSYTSSPSWGAPTPKIALFSACRQLQGRREQYFWSQTMRTSDPVRMILSYRNTGPAAESSARVNRRFFRFLRAGETFIDAWKHAHPGANLSERWAALCYEASVGDKMTDWMRKGEFPSKPAPASKILYFDSKTTGGREVKAVTYELDCWLTYQGSAGKVPPWYLFGNDSDVDIHVQLVDPAARMVPGDRLFLVASQVRPDYFGPFGIQGLVKLEGQDALMAAGKLKTSRRIHGNYPDYGDDTYELTLGSSGHTAPSADGRSVKLRARLGKAQNEHIPLYYFHVAVRGSGGHNYGMKADVLEDEAQFGMFRLPW